LVEKLYHAENFDKVCVNCFDAELLGGKK